MELLVVLGILLVLSGPVAFLMCIILFGKLRTLEQLVRRPHTHQRTQVAPAQRVIETVKPPVKPPPVPVKPPAKPPAPVVRQEVVTAGRDNAPRLVDKGVVAKEQAVANKKPAAAGSMLEERIGTRWVLIAGVIAVMFAAGVFLKYAYDNFSISDMGKIIVVTVSGLLALAIGEISRRRGYDIVAKGVTALGFVLLYGAVFSAYVLFDLIDVYPAFGLAIVITVAAMAYAVVLDEVLIAFLSLLGGFATPILVSSGENLPGPLFSYVLILSVGAMLCSYYRRWRTVNILAVIGTYALYMGWYENFFRKQFYAVDGLPEQTGIALAWLGVFRIAAFFATGITLVGVSYLYQFLNKKGFFEPLLGDQADNGQQLSAASDEQEFSG